MTDTPDITLQINVCGGDVSYLDQTVPAIIATHRSAVREVVLVADACRPQSTPSLHAARTFPAREFAARLERLRELCGSLLSARTVDRVVWLESNPDVLRVLNRKYSGRATSRSHDHLGHAFSAYFLGWDSARTRYLAHFDADIVLWQQPGFEWLRAAAAALERDPTLMGASPRIAPPPVGAGLVDVTANGSGWLPTWPLVPTNGGWRSPWFSTRCHLLDRERLAMALPLRPARGQAREGFAAFVDGLLAPLHARGLFTAGSGRVWRAIGTRLPAFPLPPEVLLHENAPVRGFGCLYLDDPRAWFIHPDTKPEVFHRLLPRLLAAVGQRGECPAAQHGVNAIQFGAWESSLESGG